MAEAYLEQRAIQETRQALAKALRHFEETGLQEPLREVVRKAGEQIKALEPPDGPPRYVGQVQKQLKDEAAVALARIEQARHDAEHKRQAQADKEQAARLREKGY